MYASKADIPEYLVDGIEHVATSDLDDGWPDPGSDGLQRSPRMRFECIVVQANSGVCLQLGVQLAIQSQQCIIMSMRLVLTLLKPPLEKDRPYRATLL